LDHVYIGYCNESPKPDSSEVMDWNWYSEEELALLLKINPKLFTEWFKLCFDNILKCEKIIKQLKFR
jgi:isopentenyl-diphosphate delta-isomerase